MNIEFPSSTSSSAGRRPAGDPTHGVRGHDSPIDRLEDPVDALAQSLLRATVPSPSGSSSGTARLRRSLSSPALSEDQRERTVDSFEWTDSSSFSGDLTGSLLKEGSSDITRSSSCNSLDAWSGEGDLSSQALTARTESAAQRALRCVAHSYQTSSGLLLWLRSQIFLGPQRSIRPEMAERRAVRECIRKEKSQGADHGTRTVIAAAALSATASAVGFGATIAKFICILFKAVAIAAFISSRISPIISIAASGFLALASIARVVRQSCLRNAAAKALGRVESNPAMARQEFRKLVGEAGPERAAKVRALRWILGKDETEIIMVLAQRLDDAEDAGHPADELDEMATKGLATLQSVAGEHRLTTLLTCLFSIAAVVIIVALLFNPVSGPLLALGIAVTVLSAAVSIYRGIRDRSLRLDRLELRKVSKPVEAQADFQPPEIVPLLATAS